MLLLVQQVLIILSLLLPIFVPCAIHMVSRLLQRPVQVGDNVLDVVQKAFFVFLVGGGVLVRGVDLAEVGDLVAEEAFDLLDGVEEGVVFAGFLGAGVEVVEEFDEALVELDHFDVGGAALDASLQDGNLLIDLSNSLLLLNHLIILCVVLVVNLLQNSRMFLIFNLLPSLTRLL